MGLAWLDFRGYVSLADQWPILRRRAPKPRAESVGGLVSIPFSRPGSRQIRRLVDCSSGKVWQKGETDGTRSALEMAKDPRRFLQPAMVRISGLTAPSSRAQEIFLK